MYLYQKETISRVLDSELNQIVTSEHCRDCGNACCSTNGYTIIADQTSLEEFRKNGVRIVDLSLEGDEDIDFDLFWRWVDSDSRDKFTLKYVNGDRVNEAIVFYSGDKIRNPYGYVYSQNGFCPLLDLETRGCKSYESRPKGCQLYPITQIGEGQVTIDDVHCPAAKKLVGKIEDAMRDNGIISFRTSREQEES